jgi:hypothetical protein
MHLLIDLAIVVGGDGDAHRLVTRAVACVALHPIDQ